MSNNYLVILAGGVGSRFWPLSHRTRPKQFQDVLGCGRTILQMTFDHFKPLFPVENIWVVTLRTYRDYVREQLPDVPARQILLEPLRRNTAASIAYAGWHIKALNPNANIVVTPSDHLISDIDTFRQTIASCMDFTAETDSVVTLGIRPNRPETGYGYIEADMSYASSRNGSIFRVDHFIEKPTLEMALDYVTQSNIFWNSGIFIWSVNTLVNAYRVYRPDMAKFFGDMQSLLGTEHEQTYLDAHYASLEDISVDYAIMEKMDEFFVFAARFGWRDLGSWSSLHDELPKDVHGNAAVGNIDLYDSNNCIVHVPDLNKVVVEGLDGYIVAQTEGTLLICKLSDEQRISLFHDGGK